MKIKGAIFDMDGTLVDSMFMWYELGNLYLKKRGKTPEPGLYDMLTRMTMLEAAQFLKDKYGFAETPEELVRDIYMCVASATDTYMIEYALEHTGLRDYFQSVFCCRQVGEGKHSDKIYQVAREDLGSAVEETLVFEDALHAAETVKRAGFPLVAVWDASEKEQERLKALGDIYLESYEECIMKRNCQSCWQAVCDYMERR